MKTTINLLIILLFAILSWWIFIYQDIGKFSHHNDSFTFQDTASISKIFMADMGGHQVILNRKSKGQWQLNGHYKARKTETQTLLHTLAQMKIKNPVPESALENVSRSMASINTKVELYNRKGKLLHSFYVGPPNEKMNGNFMKMEGSDKLYLVHIPGFDGQLSTRFFVEENLWRDRSVFQIKPNRFHSISLSYPQIPDSSFSLYRNNRDSFTLINPDTKEKILEKLNQKKARTYASYFKNLKYEVIVNNNSKRDSIISTTPFCVIEVVTAEGDTQKIEVYYKPVDKRTKAQITEKGEAIKYDLDRWYGIINNGKELVIIQQFVFGKVLAGPMKFRIKKQLTQ